MSATIDPRTITVEQAAAELGIGRNQAYEAVHAGQIPSIRIGRRILIPKEAFERLISGQFPGRAA